MDANSKPATATKATDSSSVISSLVSSCDQLEMSPGTSDGYGNGPIHRMPNEMMQNILAKLALDGDANRLIRLRLVSKRWCSQVDYYCQQNKCLLVNCDHIRCHKTDLACFPTPVSVRSNSVDHLGTILSLFGNTDKLAISDEADLDDSQLRTIAGHIESLISLKRLQLYYGLVRALPYMAQTLSRLEYLGLGNALDTLTQAQVLQIVSLLGPACVRVFFGEAQLFNAKLLHQWHNAQWLASLTHLQMLIREEIGEMVHYFAQNAPSLQYLDFHSIGTVFKLTSTVFRELAKLTHLSELKLFGIVLDIDELDQAHTQRQLTSLSSVLACKFLIFDDPNLVSDDSFTRVLSVIFPNLVDLDLSIGRNLIACVQTLTVRGIEPYLYRFTKLLKHTIHYSE